MNQRVVIVEVAGRLLYWVLLAASLWILLRGHNAPGGGFIGGLVAVSASVLYAVAFGSAAALRRLPFGTAVRCLSLGVLMSALAGVPAWWTGDHFLTHLWGTLPLGFTEVKVSTVLVFDVGVYLCVWGALAGYALALLDLDEVDESNDAGAAGNEERAR